MKTSIANALLNVTIDMLDMFVAAFGLGCVSFIGVFGSLAMVFPMAVAGTLMMLGIIWSCRNFMSDAVWAITVINVAKKIKS